MFAHNASAGPYSRLLAACLLLGGCRLGYEKEMPACEETDLTWYADADGDSFGDPTVSMTGCVQPIGFVSDSTDCADRPDSDPLCGGLAGSLCHPGLVDTCGGVDNDCDASVDEDGPGEADMQGYWDVTELATKRLGDSIRMSYATGATQDGRILCDLPLGSTLWCWWTELPSRAPPNDAGNALFTFACDGNGVTATEQWSFDDTMMWEQEVVYRYQDALIPPALEALFENDAEFIPRP